MNSSSQIEIKRKLIEATEAVRKKFNLLKQTRVTNKSELEELYEPVTKRLKSISDAVEQTKPKIPEEITKDNKQLETSDFLEQIHLDNTIFPPSPFSLRTSYNDSSSTPLSADTHRLDTRPGVESKKLTFSSEHKKPHTKAMEYLEKLKTNISSFDTTYGIYIGSNNKLKMGDTEVRFPPGNITFRRNNKSLGSYPATDELLQLIFLKKPDALDKPDKISEETKNVYREILFNTNVLYKEHNPSRSLKKSRTKKYINLIKPLISNKGGRLTKLPIKKYINLKGRQTDYIYWNTTKELVNRLRLLWSSKMAGNTAHDNEILSIIEELREEDIIY